MKNEEQYKICKERGGHVSNGVSFSNTGYNSTTYYTCKFCSVKYYVEPAHQAEV